jgi:hypothetical protein
MSALIHSILNSFLPTIHFSLKLWSVDPFLSNFIPREVLKAEWGFTYYFIFIVALRWNCLICRMKALVRMADLGAEMLQIPISSSCAMKVYGIDSREFCANSN